MKGESRTDMERPNQRVRADAPAFCQCGLEATIGVAADWGVKNGLEQSQYVRTISAIMWVLECHLALQNDDQASG